MRGANARWPGDNAAEPAPLPGQTGQIIFPLPANSGCRRAAAFSGFPSFNSASADKTRLAVAIPPFGSIPVAAAFLGAADFCSPHIPTMPASAFRRKSVQAHRSRVAETSIERIQLPRR